ncbi:hypothetical protein LJC29_03995 [Bacteroides sp. OttesenSCG-928-N06]|nr:hypothetical protein [Bacteroides sp. OttesenSCG-928-N06]
MNKFILLGVFFFQLHSLYAQQNLEFLKNDNDVTFSSDRIIFRTKESLEKLEKSGIKRLDYWIWIVAEDLQDLSSLKNLEFVKGLLIRNVPSLTGLNNLRKIGKNGLSITQNIRGFQGLENLELIEGGLSIHHCEELETFQGLENLKSCAVLNIAYCASLRSLLGLNIKDYIYSLTISNCNNLTSIQSLHQIRSIGANLEIKHCPQLKSLDGLQNVVSWGHPQNGHDKMTPGLIVNDCKRLRNFCSITTMVRNHHQYIDFSISGNMYNPTFDQLKAGECSFQFTNKNSEE